MKIKAPEALMAAEVTRRGLMKTTAIGGTFFTSGIGGGRAVPGHGPGKRSVERLYGKLWESLPAAYACGGWRDQICRNR